MSAPHFGKSLPFRRLVARELRATWWARFRWLWLLLALGIEAAAWLIPPWDISDVAIDPEANFGFMLFLAAACWAPAWLGADLLSLRFPGNPHPHREWPPREFLARTVGRLLPFFLVETIWLTTAGIRRAVGPAPSPETFAGFAGWLGAWILVLLTAGLFYFSWAAWLSSMSRRPRRWLIAPLVGLVWPVALVCLLIIPQDPTEFLGELVKNPHQLPMVPCYLVGALAALRIDEWFPSWSPNELVLYVLLACAAFAVCTAPPASAIWWIALKRSRR